ncbi:hypothetical protein QN277_028558 [Acacia crassicarpa]|uniref:NAB domain-containing protein n=1 Tax=Acacia crassicarpa TaxID=499986 RepID=A0AAE1J5W3_9FABA|nr:hypothetical protein QN277_028558 [Acacia crassicarpa]
MLHRAASNAYSWWWASHIRTKQSKWMEQNLQDFQDKVEAVMTLLEEDGDSFAKRANMYYKGRPELINFVEESFRAYRALAERYDHISKELQNANTTIASICPEQVPFMDEDDDDGSPKPVKRAPEGFKPGITPSNVPKPPRKDLKAVITSATKKYCPKKVVTRTPPKEPIKSGLSKKEALEEIDKHQKQILALQTVKEFMKSTYDHAVQKYWDTEEEIKRLQERVSLLHDEFGERMVIEDDVARRLMTAAALKTCQETLDRLRVKQERSFDQTKIENKRVKAVKEKLESLMHKLRYDQVDRPEPRERKNVKRVVNDLDKEVEKMDQQKQELQLLQDQIKEKLAAGSSESISVSDMAEKIDELVNKVISLETSISSQDALVTRLRSETDELQSQIVTLEDDKAGLIDEKNDLTTKLREMDERMQDIQDLNEMVETQSTDLQSHFTEALCDLDHFSEEVPIVKPDERDKIPNLIERETESSGNAAEFADDNVQKDNKINDIGPEKDRETNVTGLMDNVVKKDDNEIKVTDSLENEAKSDNKLKATESLEKEEASSSTRSASNKESKEANSSSESSRDQKEENATQSSSENENAHEVHSQEPVATTTEDEPNWRQLFMDGIKDKEKLLLTEYTNILRNYKAVKKTLSELEKKNEEILFDTSLKLKELKSSNALKDEEIKLLHQRLGVMGRSLEENEHVKKEEDDDDEILLKVHEPDSTSGIEEKFRRSIDEILEENLGFWMKFSTTFTEIQRYQTTIEDLQADISKLEENGKSESIRRSMKSEARPIFKHLAEIQNELSVWLDKGASLKEELQHRSSSLFEIQEEITMALKASAEDYDFKFTSYQAAKFQGEVLNMKQENNKVADELQVGLDHVSALQYEVDKILTKLGEQYGLSNSKKQRNTEMRYSDSSSDGGNRSQVPLGAFIFGFKPKKPRHSIFHGISPGMHRKYLAAIKGHHL